MTTTHRATSSNGQTETSSSSASVVGAKQDAAAAPTKGYTQGPWTPEPWLDEEGPVTLGGRQYSLLAFPFDYGRARACVNYCAGMPTDDLHHTRLLTLLETAKTFQAECASLLEQNRVLREALKGTLSWLTSYPGGGALKCYDAARDALATKGASKP